MDQRENLLQQYRLHRDASLGILCLICAYNLKDWGVAFAMPGVAKECSECGWMIGSNEQLRFNKWIVEQRIGTNVDELSVAGIEQYARVVPDRATQIRLEFLVETIRELELQIKIIETANSRLLGVIGGQMSETVQRLNEQLRERLGRISYWTEGH